MVLHTRSSSTLIILSVIVNVICKYFETKQKQQINMNKVAETKMTLRATLYLFVAESVKSVQYFPVEGLLEMHTTFIWKASLSREIVEFISECNRHIENKRKEFNLEIQSTLTNKKKNSIINIYTR